MLFTVALVGLLCRKMRYLTDEGIQSITKIIVNVALPMLTISKLQTPFSQEVFIGVIISFVLSAILMLLTLGLSYVAFRNRPASRRTALANLITFSNCGFMGYPLILSINPDWMIYAVSFNTSFNILSWSIGAALFQTDEKMDLKKVFLSLPVLSAIVGMALYICQIRIPALLLSTMDLIGGITTPLSMLIIGSRIYGLKLSHFKDKDYHISAILRLIAAPLLSFALMYFLPISHNVFATMVIMMAMPAASTVLMQAELYGGDQTFIARAVAYSTLLSIVTIPLITLLLF